MDLFRINRYLGEEFEDTCESETTRLARFQQQIAERVNKRQRESGQSDSKELAKGTSKGQEATACNGEENVVEEDIASTGENKKSKRAKKRHDVGKPDVREEEQIIKTNSKGRTKTKKQKRKKPKPEISENNLSQVEEDDDQDEEKEKEKELSTDTKNVDLDNKDEVEESNKTENRVPETSGFTIIGGKMKEKKVQKVHRVLPEWLAKPIVIDSDLSRNLVTIEDLQCLDLHLIEKLREKNIKTFFPVQSQVIPAILSRLDKNTVYGRHGYQPSDVCVSAPTGSGKTLAYALPIIQTAMKRAVRRLQALIILPTKDLASQVKQVFCFFTEGTGLRVGCASGEKSFAKEQEQLVDSSQGGTASRVDILVATPGRLVDHITSTPQFTLRHLWFLVIDEADRLLEQAFHGWLGKVLKAVYKQPVNSQDFSLDLNNRFPTSRLESRRRSPMPLSPASLSQIHLPLQKLLFSATLTHNPEKLAPLHLYQPTFFLAQATPDDSGIETVVISSPSTGRVEQLSSRYCVPAGLTEYMTISESGEKPLIVLYLVTQLKLQRVLCFASSVESTHRLYLLVKLFGGVETAEYSSSLSPHRRRGILRDFRKGNIQLLICSDAMARGMDIENVLHVISYDAPNFVKTYIHRVGRTARAGNTGTAFTLLHSEEVYHFKQIIHKTGREKIAKYGLKNSELESLVGRYQECLEELRETLRQEKQNTSQSKGRSAAMRLIKKQIAENLRSLETA